MPDEGTSQWKTIQLIIGVEIAGKTDRGHIVQDLMASVIIVLFVTHRQEKAIKEIGIFILFAKYS